MLRPPVPIAERILVFGPPGSGKTTGWLDIASYAEKTKSDSRFYVADSDFSVDRMLVGYPSLTDRILVSPVYDFPDYQAFATDVLNKARPNDWVILDFIGSAWPAVQSYFTEQVFNQDIGDYFLEARKELSKGSKSLSALEGWTDWQVINALYRRWINPLLFKGQYHIYATCKGDTLSSPNRPTEDTATRQLFLPYGSKPVGQKDLPFQFHTVLLTGRTNDNRTITAVKDRERQEVRGLEVKSFTIDYLIKVAGWKP
jgi:hypothetical protein